MSEHPASPAGVPGALLDPAAGGGEDLTYPGSAGVLVNAYLARPAAPGSYPGMIVIHEAGGLRDHIRDVTRRIANLGYLALGIDLYTRDGGPPADADMQAILAYLFQMSDATVLG